MKKARQTISDCRWELDLHARARHVFDKQMLVKDMSTEQKDLLRRMIPGALELLQQTQQPSGSNVGWNAQPGRTGQALTLAGSTTVAIPALPPLPFNEESIRTGKPLNTKAGMSSYIMEMKKYISAGGAFDLNTWTPLCRSILALDMNTNGIQESVINSFKDNSITTESLIDALEQTYVRGMLSESPLEDLKRWLTNKKRFNINSPFELNGHLALVQHLRSKCGNLPHTQEMEIITLARDNFSLSGLMLVEEQRFRQIWEDEKRQPGCLLLNAITKVNSRVAEINKLTAQLANILLPNQGNPLTKENSNKSDGPVRNHDTESKQTGKPNPPKENKDGDKKAPGLSALTLRLKENWGKQSNCRKCGSAHSPPKP